MGELKRISTTAIPHALEMAERYRLLNQPFLAESICLDVLDIAPDNQRARIMLILALTDQFDTRLQEAFTEAMAAIKNLAGDYERAYYTGVVYERRARAHWGRATPGAGYQAYGWFQQAMKAYEEAGTKRHPEGVDDYVHRWNACIRTMEREPGIQPEPKEAVHHMLE